MWRALRWGVEIFWVYVQNFLFRTMMFFNLDRLWASIISIMPRRYVSVYRQKKQRVLRNAVMSRRVYRQWLRRASRDGLLNLKVRDHQVGE